jgi:hypothetical protein
MFETFAGCAFPKELNEKAIIGASDYTLRTIWNDFHLYKKEMGLESDG